jgi:hypothetical protein
MQNAVQDRVTIPWSYPQNSRAWPVFPSAFRAGSCQRNAAMGAGKRRVEGSFGAGSKLQFNGKSGACRRKRVAAPARAGESMLACRKRRRDKGRQVWDRKSGGAGSCLMFSVVRVVALRSCRGGVCGMRATRCDGLEMAGRD